MLSVRLRCRLPGTNTIPEQIATGKSPYYQALEAADKASAGGKIDVSRAENLLGDLLANQLASVLRAAKSSAALDDRNDAV